MAQSWQNEKSTEKKEEKNWELPFGIDPMTVMKTASAYWQSCILHAANRLDVFNLLDKGPKDIQTLCRETKTGERELGTLLTACVAMGYLDREGDVFRNSKLSQTFLCTSSDFYQGGIVYMFENWYEAWGKLYKVVTTGEPAALMHKEYTEKETRDYMMGMHNRALSQAPVLTAMVDLTGKKQLMDVGCGPSTFAIKFCEKHPELKAIAIDRPENIKIAREIIAQYKMEDRVKTIIGDYNTDDLGTGNDAMLLSSMTNQESPDKLKQLLAKCYKSMNSGGIIIIQEQLLDKDKKGPLLAALIGINQVVNTTGGKSYSSLEMEDMLAEVGFVKMVSRQMSPPSPFVLLTAVKP